MPSRSDFSINSGSYKLSQIAEYGGCELDKQFNDTLIRDVKSLLDAGDNDITFLNNKKYITEFDKTKAKACIVPFDFDIESDTILLKSKNPYYSYAKIIGLFYKSAKQYAKNKIEPSAYVADSAKIGSNCYIGHNVVIEDGAEIGDDSIIESGSVIDYNVQIGNNAMIYSNVSISNAIIGNDVVILSGTRVGCDGFGFATNELGQHKKIYHVGSVIVGNNVEIGANTTIDRGSMNDTIIEDYVRIDNLVQIGHNVHIKRGAVIVAQAGVAGSSTIGSYAALGGQAGVAGHVEIADKVQIAAQGGVMSDITKPKAIMGGSPAVPVRDWHRQTIILKKLTKTK